MKSYYFFKPFFKSKNKHSDTLIDVFRYKKSERIILVPGTSRNSVICNNWKKIGTWKIKSN